jgi:hypothetical protein
MFMQVQDIRDILHSQCPSAEPLLLRQVRTGPPLTAGLQPGSVVVTVLAAVQALSEAQGQDSSGLAARDGWGSTGGSAGTGGGVRSLADVADAAGAAGGYGAGDVGDGDVEAEEERG